MRGRSWNRLLWVPLLGLLIPPIYKVAPAVGELNHVPGRRKLWPSG